MTSSGDSGSAHPCVCCEGTGCEECDGTGQRYSQGFDVDGATVMIHGSGDFNPELIPLFKELAAAAGMKMRELED